MKDLSPKFKLDKAYYEFYWGIGLGFTHIKAGQSWVIVLPFLMILITEKVVSE